jgi:hypothetical protein
MLKYSEMCPDSIFESSKIGTKAELLRQQKDEKQKNLSPWTYFEED